MISNYRYRPWRYFIATFVATYSLWFAGAYLSLVDSKANHMLLMLLGLMAPFIISLFMLFKARNHALKKDFLNRLINPKLIQARFIPAFVLIMPFAVLISILVSIPFGGSPSQFYLAEGFSFSAGFIPVLLLLLLAATFEELGWRGYAFDSLQSRFSYFKASLIFSLLWSIWHIPLLFVKDSYQYEIFHQNVWFAINFYISIIPMGIIISWICIKNGKSILAAIAFHFIINISQETLAITQATKCIETVVLALIAASIVYKDKALFFSTDHLANIAPKWAL